MVAARGFSLGAVSGKLLFVAVHGLLIAVGLVGSAVVVRGLSSSAACGIFPDQGLNLHALHWQADS